MKNKTRKEESKTVRFFILHFPKKEYLLLISLDYLREKHDREKKQRRAQSRANATTTTDGRDSLVTRGEVSKRTRFTVTTEESFRRQSASSAPDDEKGGGGTTTTARARTTTTTTTKNGSGWDSKFYTGRVKRWDRDGAREARVRETLAAAPAAKAPRRNDFYAAGRRRRRRRCR